VYGTYVVKMVIFSIIARERKTRIGYSDLTTPYILGSFAGLYVDAAKNMNKET
jgi:hypothetical protein